MAYCKGRPTTSEWTRPSSRRWRKHGALFGHPASRMLTINENVIEVENARTYVAGPGRTPVRAIDPQTRRTEPVAIDLLPAGLGRAALTTTPEHLQSTLRRWAPVFDRCAHTPEALL